MEERTIDEIKLNPAERDLFEALTAYHDMLDEWDFALDSLVMDRVASNRGIDLGPNQYAFTDDNENLYVMEEMGTSTSISE